MNNLDIIENVQNFLRGVNKYYEQCDYRRVTNQVIWQEGSTKVINYSKPDACGNLPIIFFIPSLINKSYILDLTPETSLVKYFAELGYRVYLVDFNEPNDDELTMGFINYQERLSRALNDLCENCSVVTIGYCLGGLFSFCLNAVKRTNIIGQILIAAPWDFTHLQQYFALNNPLIFHQFTNFCNGLNKIPPSLVQLFFTTIFPKRIWDKFCHFSLMNNQDDVDKFLAIEQWVNDGISISKQLALECLDIIAHNSLKMGTSDICNKLTKYNLPSLLINGSEDKIVPTNSTQPLCDLVVNHEMLIEKTGHIGLIVSSLAQEKIWPKMQQWLVNLINR